MAVEPKIFEVAVSVDLDDGPKELARTYFVDFTLARHRALAYLNHFGTIYPADRLALTMHEIFEGEE